MLEGGALGSGGASPLTTKGDVYTHDATVDARLPVGADTFVLTADSAQLLGVKWAAAGTFTPTGTGFGHVSAGVWDAASKLVDTADINPDQVTYPKIQNVAGNNRVLGRVSGAGGDIEELTAAQLAVLLAKNVVTKTANFTATAAESVILCNAGLGGFTITLPAAAGISGKEYEIKKIDATGNVVTVDGNAAETIDGDPTFPLDTEDAALWLVSDGANWQVL